MCMLLRRTSRGSRDERVSTCSWSSMLPLSPLSRYHGCCILEDGAVQIKEQHFRLCYAIAFLLLREWFCKGANGLQFALLRFADSVMFNVPAMQAMLEIFAFRGLAWPVITVPETPTPCGQPRPTPMHFSLFFSLRTISRTLASNRPTYEHRALNTWYTICPEHVYMH